MTMDYKFTDIKDIQKPWSDETFSGSWDEVKEYVAAAATIKRKVSDKTFTDANGKEQPGPNIAAIMPGVKIDTAGSKSESNIECIGGIIMLDVDNKQKDQISFGFGENVMRDNGWQSIMYTSTSHTNTKHCYRVMISASRYIDTDEYTVLWHFLNKQFNNLLDQQTKNINRTFYLPADWQGVPNKLECIDGVPLDVDAILNSDVGKQIKAELDNVVKATSISDREITSRIRNATTNQFASVQALMQANVIRASDINDWRINGSGRLFSFFNRVAMRLVRRNVAIDGPTLASWQPEFDQLIGRTTPREGYNRVLAEANKAVTNALRNVLAAEKTQAAAVRNVMPKRKSDLTVEYIDAQCGMGKTYQMLRRIAEKGGWWIYACDKIHPTMSQRKSEFNGFCSQLGKYGFAVETVHSKANKDEQDDAEDYISVSGQVSRVYSDWSNSGVTDGIMFITHKALTMLDWSDWEGSSLVIDECIDTLANGSLDIRTTHALWMPYFDVTDTHEGLYRLSLTAEGRKLHTESTWDDGNKGIRPIVNYIAEQNNELWVEKEAWDKPSDGAINYYAILTPYVLKPFSYICAMGDQLALFPFYTAWKDNYTVDWIKADWFKPRLRKHPLNGRVTIKYFMKNSNLSIRTLKSSSGILPNILTYAAKSHRSYYYSINAKFEDELPQVLENNSNFVRISPKSHGRNDLQHHNVCVWLVAMKLSGMEAASFTKATGASREIITLTREYNACYQFVMRSVLRDYDSDEQAIIYVASKDQAQYLAERFGITDERRVVHVQGIVHDPEAKKPGKAAGAGVALNSTQRSQLKRAEDKAVKNGMPFDKAAETAKILAAAIAPVALTTPTQHVVIQPRTADLTKILKRARGQ